MINSILDSVKKTVGIDPADTAFDDDILMHINSVFSDLNQLGIGPADGFEIQDKTTEWAVYTASVKLLNNVKTYMYLRVRMLFDPPATSFLLDAMQRQTEQLEWRINIYHEGTVTI